MQQILQMLCMLSEASIVKCHSHLLIGLHCSSVLSLHDESRHASCCFGFRCPGIDSSAMAFVASQPEIVPHSCCCLHKSNLIEVVRRYLQIRSYSIFVPAQMRPVGHLALQASAQGWHLLHRAAVAFFDVLGSGTSALWTHVLLPAEQALAFMLRSLWRSVLQPLLESIYAAGAAVLAWLNDGIMQPVVNAIASALAACGNAVAWVLLSILDVVMQYVVHPVLHVLNLLVGLLFKYVFAPAALVIGFLGIIVLGVVLLLNQLGFNIRYGRYGNSATPRTAYPSNQW